MINSIKISKLRNSEILQFFKDIASRCKLFNPKELKIMPVLTFLINQIVKLDDTYNKESGSDITEDLIDGDANRDNDVVGIRTVSEGYIYSRNTTIVNAAKLILDSIDRQGKSIARLNYQAETIVISAILKDWEQDELKNALEILNLTEWAAALKAENKKFSETYQKRLDDKLETAGISFTQLRADGINAYRALCNTISAYSVIDNKEEYPQLINAFNLIIADYNAIIEKREVGKETSIQA